MSASQMRLRREDTSPSPETASVSASEFSSDSWSDVGAGDDGSPENDDLSGLRSLLKAVPAPDTQSAPSGGDVGLLAIYNDNEDEEAQEMVEINPENYVSATTAVVGSSGHDAQYGYLAETASSQPSVTPFSVQEFQEYVREYIRSANAGKDVGGQQTYRNDDDAYHAQANAKPTIEDQLQALQSTLATNQALLLNHLSAQADQITSLQTQIRTLKDNQPYPLRPSPGVSPEKVTEIATSLATGEMDAFEAAEEMFKWIEKCNAKPQFDEGRDGLEPMVRIGNLEGVLDVTLGRVGRLEKEVEGMKREMMDETGTVMGDDHMRESSVLSDKMDEDMEEKFSREVAINEKRKRSKTVKHAVGESSRSREKRHVF